MKLFRLFVLVTLVIFSSGAVFGSAKVGKAFPKQKVKLLGKKKKISISKYKGRVVIVDFWATWCEPCKKELPALVKLKKKFGKRGLRVIGINVDDDEAKAIAFLKEQGIKIKSAYDKNKKLAEKLGLAAMPTSYVLDRKGKIRFIHNGFNDADIAKFETEVKSLL